LADAEVQAAQWLSSGNVPNANIHADARMGIAEIAILAQKWLKCGWIMELFCP
jgi:hypothetical protein